MGVNGILQNDRFMLYNKCIHLIRDERSFPVMRNLPTFTSNTHQPFIGTNSAENMNQPPKEQCEACLITGVMTCTGISAYFFKTALLDMPESAKKEVMRQKRFLLGFGSAWAIAGAYRLYLG